MPILKKLIKYFFAWEARRVLKKYKPKIIAVTGSVGKTSTKDMIYLVLSSKYFVRKSEKSFTTELSVPLTVIGCSYGSGSLKQWAHNVYLGVTLLLFTKPYPEILILEINNDKPGDVRSVSSWLSPEVIVMTAIGEVPAHIEMFENIESSLLERRALLSSLPADGTLVYNADDAVVTSLVESVADKSTATSTENSIESFHITKIPCGKAESDKKNVAVMQGSDLGILYGGKDNIPTGMTFDLTHKDETYSITMLGSIGENNEYAFLLACGVACTFDIPIKKAVELCSKYVALPGRMNLVMGIHDSVILDDSYNSSPIALHQALETVQKIQTKGKKIVVVGDMMELGKYSAAEHRKMAARVKAIADEVVCVGMRAAGLGNELVLIGFDTKKIHSVPTSREAGDVVAERIGPHDLVLVKGSQAMRMERVVEKIMRHPKDASNSLVRQEPEWLARP